MPVTLQRESRFVRTCTRATSAAWDPPGGWDAADRARRAYAVALLPTLVLWSAVAATDVTGEGGTLQALSVVRITLVLVLPIALIPMMYSAARVLRPYRAAHPRVGPLARHWCAATAMGFGVPTVAGLSPVTGGLADSASLVLVVLLGGSAAALLGVITLGWGAVAALLRVLTPDAGESPPPPVAAAAPQVADPAGAPDWAHDHPHPHRH